jgi:hypothetical protein
MTTINHARGPWQRDIERALLAGETVTSPCRGLKGNAARYAGRYQASFDALLQRMWDGGHDIIRTPGPRGGEWSATYRLDRHA